MDQGGGGAVVSHAQKKMYVLFQGDVCHFHLILSWVTVFSFIYLMCVFNLLKSFLMCVLYVLFPDGVGAVPGAGVRGYIPLFSFTIEKYWFFVRNYLK